MMDDEAALKESVSNVRDAVLLGRADILRSILSAAAEFREEGELFGDEDEDDPITRQRYFEEFIDPYDILKLILNYVDSDAGTCLHLATKLGFADGVRALLSAGADPTITNHEGATAFDYCTDKCILGIYNEELLQAAAGGNIPRVSRLLECGVSANACDGANSDNKVLHWVASYGTEEMVRLLCDKNADINIKNANGETPLHDAVKRGDCQIVQMFLEFGANPNIKATSGVLKGMTPVDLAADEAMKFIFTRPASIVQNGAVLGNDRDFSDADSLVSESTMSADTVPLLPSPSTRTRYLSSGSSGTKDTLFGSLWPSPQRVLEVKGGHYKPPSTLPVHIHRPNTDCLQELCAMWETLEPSFKLAGCEIDMSIMTEDGEMTPLPTGRIDCRMCPNLFTKPESYKIHISTTEVSIIASEAVSMWYALNTILQLLRLFKEKGVPTAQISDWPDVKHRGILIDVSTGRVPKLETLLSLVDILSSVKINQLQLYMQNTFAYRGHDSVHRNNTPYTQGDIIKLDKYCRERYIELIPHIESLSGFSQWLKYKQYAHLAEVPLDLEAIDEKVPSCVCPSSQDSINFVLDLHKQVFPCFSSTRFAHVGVDVTEEFGKGKSYVIAEAKGAEALYMEYMKIMYKSCRSYGRTMQFWANSLHEYPQLLSNLPTNVIAMEYGGKVDYDFMKHCRLLSDAGVSFFVCPGTLTWNSACANTDDSLTLINNAVQTAVTCDALGMLVCDWTLPGHVNPLPLSIPAFLVAAGLSWKADTDMTVVQSSLPDIVSRHAFLDASGKIGLALNDLGKVHSLLERNEPEQTKSLPQESRGVHPVSYSHEGTLLWRLLYGGGDTDMTCLDIETLQQATRHIRQCQNTYLSAKLQCTQSSEILKELAMTTDILLYLCRLCRVILLAKKQNSNVETLKDVPVINRTDLANRLLGLIAHYQKVYLLRNKQGGLLSAKSQLQKILLQLLPQENELNT